MNVKHIQCLSKNTPRKANRIQEIICDVAVFMSALLGSFGGASPLFDFAVDKCDLPSPGGDTTP